MDNITLRGLRASLTRTNSDDGYPFSDIYEKLILRRSLSSDELDFLFKMMNIFSLYGDLDLQKMSYSMALSYGLMSSDFSILDLYANRLRYYPVRMLIKANTNINSQDDLITDIDSVLAESLAEVYRGDYYRSEQQYELSRTVRSVDDLVVVAPTSYGKSHLMVTKAVEKYNNGSNVCIIVPTKSLMNQTVSIALSIKGSRVDVITHPDMYVSRYENSPFLAILTQERLMSLLARYPAMVIDYLFVDESHNLFKDEERSLTLSRAIIIAKNRAASTRVDFYSPFIASPDTSLSFVGSPVLDNRQEFTTITEHMKIPRYYIWDDTTKKLELFDQFTNNFYEDTSSIDSYYNLLLNRGAEKNIIYLNKPSDVEKFADALADRLTEVDYSAESKIIIDDACKIFSKYVHQSYNLIKLLKRGVVLNHGKMPDIIKEHVEFLYRSVDEVRFIATTSTLLEGVNVPASKLFLINYSKGLGSLNISDFKNLAGRVGRYNTIFNLDSPKLGLLAPEIYVVKNDEYMRHNSNPRSFLSSHAKEGTNIVDDIDNPLLVSYVGSDKQARLLNEASVLANIDKTRSDNYRSISSTDPLLAQTELGFSCFAHNVKIFDVIRYEHSIFNKIESMVNTNRIVDGESLLSTIIAVFLETTYQVEIKIDKHRYGNWAYLLYSQPYIKDIYKAIIDQKTRSDTSFSSLIARSVSSWSGSMGSPVYVGDIGNCDASGVSDSRWNKYVIFSARNRNLMPSYAAALAKENLDNVDNYIIPFVEILNDFSVIDEAFYKRIKYGTDNDFMIALLRAGFDYSLAKLIFDDEDMRSLISVEQESPVCANKSAFIQIMSDAHVSLMYINSVDELL